MVGAAGLQPTLAAIEAGKDIALANKETLVMAGERVIKRASEKKVRILPVDSEHSAIFQCLQGHRRQDVEKILLTASGGPFLNRNWGDLRNITPADAINHPTWQMGPKISVDSATLMNKGLEVIEAHHLFQMPPDRIKVVVHPEAICHSLVQFIDGTMMAQLSTPDMKLPIQHSLIAPRRRRSLVKCLDINRIENLEFIRPDFKKFPCLLFAYEALKVGKSMPAVLNAANEEAVRLFLENRIEFRQIPQIIKKVMDKHRPQTGAIKDYIAWAAWAKNKARSLA